MDNPGFRDAELRKLLGSSDNAGTLVIVYCVVMRKLRMLRGFSFGLESRGDDDDEHDADDDRDVAADGDGDDGDEKG